MELSEGAAFAVYLRPWPWRLLRGSVVLLQLACMAFFVFPAWLYHLLPTTYVALSLDLYGISVPIEYFPLLAWVHILIATAHLLLLLRRLFFGDGGVVSLWMARRLKAHHRLQHFGATLRQLNNKTPPLPRPLSLIRKSLVSSFLYFYGRRGIFGVASPHFDLLFVIRELVETALQSIQAANMARLLSRRWIHRFYVGIIVLNCWGTPLLRRVFRHDKPSQRLASLLGDIVLDFFSVVLVPVYLFQVYVRYYDPVRTDFPSLLWYQDVWLITFLHEIQLVVLTSWADAASRLVFSLNLVANINAVCNLCKPLPVSHRSELRVVCPMPPDNQRLAKQDITTGTSPEIHSIPHRGKPTSSLVDRFQKIGKIGLILWGATILGIHLHAESRATPSGCLLPVHPWLISKPACALLEINCFRDAAKQATRTSETDVDRQLAELDEASVTHVLVRHCQHVALTTSNLRKLSSLTGMKMYNTTITAWEPAAALTRRSHSSIRFVYLIRVRFGDDGVLPAGLSDADYPPTLVDLEICDSNLRELPSSLASVWPPYMYLILERTQLTQVPAVLLDMTLYVLSLAGSPVSELPAQLFESPTLINLSLGDCPLDSMPNDVNLDIVRSMTTGLTIHLYWTSISTLPEWMIEQVLDMRIRVYGGGSLLCDPRTQAALPDNASLAGSLYGDLPLWQQYIYCQRPERSAVTIYPLVSESLWSAPG
ncbi:hypothetical protein PINS_up004375 [Pythium insidiosum]|nr:hypothetical protein PINS_up004375 [Pythium insidiosum]